MTIKNKQKFHLSQEYIKCSRNVNQQDSIDPKDACIYEILVLKMFCSTPCGSRPEKFMYVHCKQKGLGWCLIINLTHQYGAKLSSTCAMKTQQIGNFDEGKDLKLTQKLELPDQLHYVEEIGIIFMMTGPLVSAILYYFYQSCQML